MISVLITDDHPVVRQGIKQILETCKEIDFIDEASDGSECLNKILKRDYRVALLDISMPGRSGLDLLKDIKRIKPGIAVLMLSIYPEEQYAVRAIKTGASGYLTKSSAPEELITAILKAARGGKYITQSLAERMAFEFDTNADKPLHENLSDREMEVMCLIAQGKSPKEIAESMAISQKTVSTYRERLLGKMNLASNTEIIRYAIKNGLVD
ncbi:MAG: response regulator transcription factor [Bacteroidales bacterium]|nr:response regulator transcription factor [Bacteroidales bacterium]